MKNENTTRLRFEVSPVDGVTELSLRFLSTNEAAEAEARRFVERIKPVLMALDSVAKGKELAAGLEM
jgi:hypothetical protein